MTTQSHYILYMHCYNTAVGYFNGRYTTNFCRRHFKVNSLGSKFRNSTYEDCAVELILKGDWCSSSCSWAKRNDAYFLSPPS